MDQFERLSQNSVLISQLGVTQTEFKMYLQLLSTGPCTKTDFANRFKIPRTTVFANVERLSQKGLVSQITQNNRNIVIAENPKKLQVLALNRKIELEEELNIAKNASKELSSFINSISDNLPKLEHENDPTVKYYIGAAGFRTVCQRSLENATDEILFITNIKTWNEIYTNDDRDYDTKERKRRKIKLKVLAVNNVEGRNFQSEDTKYNRKTSLLPEHYYFKPSIILSNDEVSIINYSPSYFATAIVMSDKDIAEFYRMFFSSIIRYG